MTKIKICGLSRDIDAEFVNEAKPDFAGFIIGVPWSKRNIGCDTAFGLRRLIDRDISTVGVFINCAAEIVAQLANDGVINIIQLHGDEDESYINKIRKLAPGTEIWKAFVVKSAEDIEKAKQCVADKVLLDSGAGCGKTFDWSIVKNIDREIILAGGLNAQNISLAVKQVHPWAVDLSSGVETEGVKDREKIISAVQAAKHN